MKKLIKIASLMTCLVLIAVFTSACGPPETITETITQSDFQQEEFICQDYALNVDFQPGKMVCSGYLEGDQVVYEIVPKIEAGVLYFQVIRLTVQGEEMPTDEFAELNEGLAEETYSAEEGYEFSSVVITDDEMVITSTLK
jgi:hypothetical protein